MKVRFVHFLVVAGLLSFMSSAEAYPPGFGMELTVSSKALANAPLLYPDTDDDVTTNVGLKRQKLIVDYIRENCPRCHIKPQRDKWDIFSYRVTFEDGWWMDVTLDPEAIEFIGASIEARSHKVMIPRLQKFVFDAALSAGLRPRIQVGGGHIHIGIKSGFEFDPVLFRNFVVDMFNYPEFAVELFEIDINNNPSIMDRKVKERNALVRFLKHFDRELLEYQKLPTELRRKRGIELIRDFAHQIETRVYTSTTVRGWEPDKYQAVSFKRITNPNLSPDEWTVELRGFRAQRSAQSFFYLIELLTRRIAYNQARGGLLPFVPYDYKNASAREKSERLVRFLDQIQMNAVDFKDAVFGRFWSAFPQQRKWPDPFQPPRADVGSCRALFH